MSTFIDTMNKSGNGHDISKYGANPSSAFETSNQPLPAVHHVPYLAIGIVSILVLALVIITLQLIQLRKSKNV